LWVATIVMGGKRDRGLGMGQQTIAVVDDDRASIEFMHDALTEEGYRVVWCLSAVEVPVLLHRTRPDLLIVDIHIEHREAGWGLIELLRGDPMTQDLPLIACSADTTFLEANAQDLQARRCLILKKPFALEVLLALLHTVIGRG
jgi:DNA-binding response OmpR family regulator